MRVLPHPREHIDARMRTEQRHRARFPILPHEIARRQLETREQKIRRGDEAVESGEGKSLNVRRSVIQPHLVF